MIDKQFLIDFETEVKERYEAGEIKAPVHLSSNNEEELIEIFKDVKPVSYTHLTLPTTPYV